MTKAKEELEEIAIELGIELRKKKKEIEYLKEQNYLMIRKLSHNLRNPIGAVVSFSDLLLESLPNLSKEELIRFLQIINSSSKHSIQIISKLSLYASLFNEEDEKSLEKINLTEIFKEILDKIQKEKKMNTNCVKIINYSNAIILGNLKLLKILFYNILENAFRYSEVQKPIKINISTTTNKVLLSVKNTGTKLIEGLDSNSVFEPFYYYNSTTTENKQVGLGLSIVKKIVEIHKGEITFVKKTKQISLKLKFLKLT